MQSLLLPLELKVWLSARSSLFLELNVWLSARSLLHIFQRIYVIISKFIIITIIIMIII
jgi:hypothetical protein